MQESPFPSGIAVQWLLGIMLIFAPLFRSGQPALAVLALELLAVSLLVVVLWYPGRKLVTRVEALALGLLFLFPLLYLVPLPAGFAALVPGRQAYLDAQALMQNIAAVDTATLSLYPLETESAWLLLLIPIAVFLGTRTLDPHRALTLVLLLLGVGVAQSLLGLLQYGAEEGSPQLFGLSLPAVKSAAGTYTNRNHLAGLLEMLLPVALALAIFSVGRRMARDSRGWRDRVVFVASAGGHATFLYGVIALLLLVGLVFTRSRAGIAFGMLGVFLSTALFARRVGGDNIYGTVGTIVVFALGIGVAIGLVPVLDRFSAEGAIHDARWTIFSSTLDGIGVFGPIGTGPGNYPETYRAFQPPELGHWFINHAHNDYLEWLFEGGLVAAGLILLLLVLVARQWRRLWTRGEWSRFRFVQVGAGIGILLLMLHSLVDYNLHIPANIVYFAFLAGIFFADPAIEVAAAQSTRRKRRTLNLEDAPVASMPMVKDATVASHPEQIRNPFLD